MRKMTAIQKAESIQWHYECVKKEFFRSNSVSRTAEDFDFFLYYRYTEHVPCFFDQLINFGIDRYYVYVIIEMIKDNDLTKK